MTKLSKTQMTQELIFCAEPLWAIERALPLLPGRVAMAAQILNAGKEQVAEANRLIEEAAFAIEKLHELGAGVAETRDADMATINDVSVRSGAGGNKPD